MIRLGVIRVEGTASIAFFPVLRIVMLADEGMVGRCTVFSLADIADGLCLAGSGSAAVFGLVQFCVADRADVPVMVAVIAPCCRRSMACCFFYNRIFIRDLGRAVFIREPLFAGGAGPIRRVAIFRAGCVLCRNSSQRVADHDLRRGNLRSVIRKCVIVIHTLESVNMKSNFHRGCQAFLRGKL